MPICPACAADVPASSRFCLSCGQQLDAATFTASDKSWSGSTPSGDVRFPPGTLLDGRYRISGRLGRGGMGEVYRADDMKLGQDVALKFLPATLQQDASMLARFHHEVKIARQVSHPNVCRVYDIAEADGQHFISMEYVDGEDLKSLLRRIGRLPEDKAVQIARQMCAGLAAAHDKGVLHRDLKPANVMLDGEGRARITDFGLAAIANEISGADIYSGTPGYMAPEQLAGREVSVASDIYSLGLVLFELFTGKPAFKATSLAELRAQQESGVSSPSTVVPGLDRAIERVILACLARHPAERPRSALAVAAALPGGDPLAAALAAGETPSPELVAASLITGGLSARAALLSVAGVIAGLVLLVRFGDAALITHYADLRHEPQVLTAHARDLLRGAGHTDEPRDFIWAVRPNTPFISNLRRSDDAAKWSRFGAGGRSPLLYFYRQSPAPLVPLNPASYRMKPEDPPPTVAGTASVWTDTAGHLVRMEVVPPERRELLTEVRSAPEVAATAADWSPLLTAAGFSATDLRSAEPAWNPPFHSDARAAWEVVSTEPHKAGLRVEAASYLGRPVFFRVLGPWETGPDATSPPGAGRQRALDVIARLLALSVMAAGFLLARRNVRLGRSDLRGAFRLVSVFIILKFAAWLLFTKYAAQPTAQFTAFMLTVAVTLFEALFLYVFYIGLEPFVRRRWPDALVSWTRALSGRLRDPLVGRDVLLGCVIGVVMALTPVGAHAVASRLAPVMPLRVDLPRLAGTRYLFGEFLDSQSQAFLSPLILLIVLVLFTLILKRGWAALCVLLALVAGLDLLSVAPNRAWPVLAAGSLIGVSAGLFSLTRLGLLATTIAYAVHAAFYQMPLTSDLSAWHATGTILAVAWTLVLAAYGAHTALAGRPVFGTEWLKE